MCDDYRIALEKIAAPKYGLQGIIEDYSHDSNKYNYYALKYYIKLCRQYENIAKEALQSND